MRKWMRDRMRKKKPAEQPTQPAAPPLQPAYFDAEQAPASASESAHASQDHEPQRLESQEVEAPALREPEFEAKPGGEETDAPSRPQVPTREGERARSRRRRGGRGRGGRGREHAVAQAFTPA